MPNNPKNIDTEAIALRDAHAVTTRPDPFIIACCYKSYVQNLKEICTIQGLADMYDMYNGVFICISVDREG